MILEVNGISFSYNGRPVLKEVSFKFNRGELVAILGPNGVGKTTLLKCINAILRPRQGSVVVDGRDVLAMESMEIARRIAYVAQRTESGRVTAFDAILMGRRPHLSWKVSEKDLAMVDAAIRRLHLESLALRYIDKMSGGELQKVAIARALVQETDLLLLDEPISSLDLKNQIEIMNLVKRLVVEHDVTAVMTMHDLNMALRYSDKYIFLKDEAIFSVGRVSEITAEMVRAVYGLPVEIHYHGGNPVVLPRREEPQKGVSHGLHH